MKHHVGMNPLVHGPDLNQSDLAEFPCIAEVLPAIHMWRNMFINEHIRIKLYSNF